MAQSIPSGLRDERGRTIAELLTTLVMTLIGMAALYSMLLTQTQLFSAQDYAVDMEQTARTLMAMITQDLRMAGYKPVQGSGFYGVTYDPAQLLIQADLNGNGTTAEVNETVIYSFNATNLQATRSTTGNQIIFRNVQGFTFSYLNGAGTSAASSADIREVSVTITTRTARPDPAYPTNYGYRTFTLQSNVAPRNLGL